MKAFGQRAASIYHMDPYRGKFSVCWLNKRIQKIKQKKIYTGQNWSRMCQEACLLPPLREVRLEAATAQNL